MRAANQFADATTGVVYIHASPAAVCPHVEWALSSTLNARANLKWTPQPAMPGQLRAVTNWVGPVGTGAQLANALRSWSVLRFEVTEDPTAHTDGTRYLHTPSLGIHVAQTDTAGNIVIGEDRMRYAMEVAGSDALALQRELHQALGQPWDDELDVFRHASEGSQVIWLHSYAG